MEEEDHSKAMDPHTGGSLGVQKGSGGISCVQKGSGGYNAAASWQGEGSLTHTRITKES